MSEAGEIPAAIAKDGAEAEGKQEEGEAVVVAAAVVDENDEDEDESVGSGSVVVAKIIDDEPPPTPTTAKLERDLATKLPHSAVGSGSKKSAPFGTKKESSETDKTPVKRNNMLPLNKNKKKVETPRDGPAETKLKIGSTSGEKKTESSKDTATAPPEKVEGKDAIGKPSVKPIVKPSGKAKGSPKPSPKGNPKEKKADKVKSEVKPRDKEVESTKDQTAVKPEPMEVDSATPAKAKNDDDTDAEEGEVEEGEVEEGEIDDPAPQETKPPSPVTKPLKEKEVKSPPASLPKKEGQVKKEKKEKDKKEKDKKSEGKESKEKKPEGKGSIDIKKKESTSMDVDDKTAKRSPKEKGTAATAIVKKEKDVPQEAPKEKEVPQDDDDEDGEIKEETDEEGEIKEAEDGEIKDDTEEEGEVKEEASKEEDPKEDVDMDDAQSQSDAGDRDVDMDTASNDGDTGDNVSLADESTNRKVEPTYSTRGRTSGSNTPVPRGSESTAKAKASAAGGSSHQSGNKTEWERSVREALDDLGRGAKDGTPAGVGAGGASFLEALGEEERRTRTRFLPAVDGIHMLRKNEIKGDLALARSIMSSSGHVASVASVAAGAVAASSEKKKSKKKKHSDGEAGNMEIDGGVLSSSEDDPSSDPSARVGNPSTLEVEPGELLKMPSVAFVPPPAATHSSAPPASNGDKTEDGAPVPPAPSSVKGILNNQRNIKSPRVVESVMAFNPPRPPESVGKKKQHRMLRWERRPADVEVDLNNYRKTVDRTRKELHTAEDELERIEATCNHLRRHFLGHLQCMEQEADDILSEFNSVQQTCVKAADLLTSRTRSRGGGKGSHVMKDVLAVLKARGSELRDKGIQIRSSNSTKKESSVKPCGIGGVGGSSFADWNQDTVIPPQRIASAWVLPGDKVATPYGEGVVVKILQNAALDVKEPPFEETIGTAASNGQSPSKMDIDSPSANAAASSSKSGSPKSSSPKSQKSSKSGASKKSNASGPTSEELSAFLGTRICVRLPYGVGYFSPAVVSSAENPDTLSDSQLAKRWGGILESALSQAGKLDLNGMAFTESERLLRSKKRRSATSEEDNEEAAPMDVDGVEDDTDWEMVPSSNEQKLLPFASRLLPTGTGRGNELFEMNAQKLQKALKPVLTDGEGVLGDKANEGVPTIIKEAEEESHETYILQAKVLQLRNELYRQRRIRTLNDRTFTATKERSMRVESLVAEMRTDLTSLRSRLDEELVELGIDQDRAEAILKSYYLSQDYEAEEEAVDEQQASPAQKRSRSEAGDKERDGKNANGNGMVHSSDVEKQTKRAKLAAV